MANLLHPRAVNLGAAPRLLKSEKRNKKGSTLRSSISGILNLIAVNPGASGNVDSSHYRRKYAGHSNHCTWDIKLLAWHPSFDRAFSGRKLKPATVTQCGEGSASRGQRPDPSASRLSRIQGRLEVTLCITDGAPALGEHCNGSSFCLLFMDGDCSDFSFLVIEMILVHLAALHSPADDSNALVVPTFQVHHTSSWVSLHREIMFRHHHYNYHHNHHQSHHQSISPLHWPLTKKMRKNLM